MMYEYLFYDFDGTICDTSPGIYATLDDTFAHYGMSVDKSLYPRYIGPPLSDTFYSYFGDRDKAYEAVAYFRNAYVAGNIKLTHLYDGIKESFARLSADGFKVCVATCKKEEEAVALLEGFGLSDYVHFVSGLKYKVRETKSEVLSHALETLRADKDRCVMIGDTDFDAEGALQCGLDCVICKWGFGDYDAINRPNVVFFADTPEDAERFVRERAHLS